MDAREKTGTMIQTAARRMGVPVEELESFLAGYNDMQVLYRSAIREVRTRLEVLDDEFSFRHRRNPIHSIQTRLKTPRSVMEKMVRRGLSPQVEVIRTEMTDIAGIRVVCSYVDDIYLLADLLDAQDGIERVRTQDYIQDPKPNGYRSLHIVVKAPVRLSDSVQKVPVEIQIRTIAMDFWASLEHGLRYKSVAKVSGEMVRELRDCAEAIAQLDERMQRLNRQVEELDGQGAPGGKAIPAAGFWGLFEELRRAGEPPPGQS